MIKASNNHSSSIKTKCRYIPLPASFAEEVFDLENNIRTKSNKEAFNQLFTLYARGIEYYSINGDADLYLNYSNKLNSLIVLSTQNSESNPTLTSRLPQTQSKQSISHTAKKIIQQFEVSLSSCVDSVKNDLESQHKLLQKYKKIRNYKSPRKSTVYNVVITKNFKELETLNGIKSNDLLNRNQRPRKRSFILSHPFERRSIKPENPVSALPDNEHFNKLNFYCNANYLTKLNAFVEELSRLNILKTRKYVDSYYSFKELDLLMKESDDNYIKDNIKVMLNDLEKETEKENLLLDQQFKANIRYYSQIETTAISNMKEIVQINSKIIDNISKII